MSAVPGERERLTGGGASTRPRLVLASRSPQRSAILARLGVPFEVRPTEVHELEEGDPEAVALENALRKARAALRTPARGGGPGGGGPGSGGHGPGGSGQDGGHSPDGGELVLGVDTVVELEGRIYGKPSSEAEARRTLRALAGQTHTVISGVALLGCEREQAATAVARTRVRFRELDSRTIDWYVATGEWRERAGGYAIQGAGAALVREVAGDYENVVGLPVATLLDLCPELL